MATKKTRSKTGYLSIAEQRDAMADPRKHPDATRPVNRDQRGPVTSMDDPRLEQAAGVPRMGQGGGTSRESIYKDMLSNPLTRALIDEAARHRGIDRRNAWRTFAGLEQISHGQGPDVAFLSEQHNLISIRIQELLTIQEKIDSGALTDAAERYSLANDLIKHQLTVAGGMENAAMQANVQINKSHLDHSYTLREQANDGFSSMDLTNEGNAKAKQAYDTLALSMTRVQERSLDQNRAVDLNAPQNEAALADFVRDSQAALAGLSGNEQAQAALTYALNGKSIELFNAPLVSGDSRSLIGQANKKLGRMIPASDGKPAIFMTELDGQLSAAFTQGGTIYSAASRAMDDADTALAKGLNVGHEQLPEMLAKIGMGTMGLQFSMDKLLEDPEAMAQAYTQMGLEPPASVASSEIQDELAEQRRQRARVEGAMNLDPFTSTSEVLNELSAQPDYQAARRTAYQEGLFGRGERGLQAGLMTAANEAGRGGVDPMLDKQIREAKTGDIAGGREPAASRKELARQHKGMVGIAGAVSPAPAGDTAAPIAEKQDDGLTPIGGQESTAAMKQPYQLRESGLKYLRDRLFRSQQHYDPDKVIPPMK